MPTIITPVPTPAVNIPGPMASAAALVMLGALFIGQMMVSHFVPQRYGRPRRRGQRNIADQP